MRKPYWGLLFILLNCFCLTIYAQESETDPDKKKDVPKELKEAYEAYDAEEYYLAIDLLKEAFSEVRGRDLKTEVLFKTAESYRMMNDYKNAALYYERAQKLGYKDNVVILYRADMLKAQGEYEEALTVYQEYKQANPTDPRGEIGIESTKEAAQWDDQPGLYQVDNMRDINSTAYDFAPVYGGKMRENDVLIFSSSREESIGNREDGWTGQSFMDLYITAAERKSTRGRGRRGGADQGEEFSAAEKKWSTPVPLDEEEILNTKFHEGSAAYDSRKKTLYFTRCVAEKSKNLSCGIYITEEVGQKWKEAERVIIGTDTFANIGDPCLSPDDSRLYFVSDDFNTKGGHDIFFTTYDRRTKSWAEPTNLGTKVNTTGNERFPFVHTDGYLYFASDGLPGMGGLDIFKVKLGEDGKPAGDPENMKYPINSSADDFALIFEPNSDKNGFLTSNRGGQRTADDIYAVFKTPLAFILEGVITSTKDGSPLENVTVRLEGGGESYVTNTDEEGYYKFEQGKLKEDASYNLLFEKKKFLNGLGDVTTIGVPLASFEYIPSENKYINTIKLNKGLDPIEVPIVLPNVFFDLGKWDLRPEAMQALDSVVTILKNNPNIVIELRSHTDYRDTDEKNKVLSQHRADTCVSYLVSKGIAKARMVARGMGETEPFVIPENYSGYGSESLESGVQLTEKYIKTLSPEKQEIANQINRRTDFKVLRDDYVPAEGENASEDEGPTAGTDTKKEEGAKDPGAIYVLQGRESFGVVARKFNLNIVELKKLNGDLRGVRPFEGLQLKIEPDGDYTKWDAEHYQIMRRGQDLKDVAKIVGADRKELEDLNKDVTDEMLQPGFWVRIK